MKTIDETFRLLCRRPIEEVRMKTSDAICKNNVMFNLASDIPIELKIELNNWLDDRDIRRIPIECGWTWDEWANEPTQSWN